MALSAEVQHGVARIYGIPPINAAVDEITWTIAGASLAAGSAPNFSSIGVVDTFKTDEIPSQDGSTIETLIASQLRREINLELLPSSTSDSPSRTEALAQMTYIMANLKPFSVITLAGFSAILTWVNSTSATDGSWNYMGGGEIMFRRDTPVIVNLRLAQFKTRADGTKYAALPLVA